MKKIITLIILGSFLYSCNSGNDADSIKAKIKSYQGEIETLNEKIAELQQQLPENGENKVVSNKTKVRVVEIAEQAFSKYFLATGEVEAINEAFISPEVNGQITSVHVIEGQKVSKGQLLAKLNTSLIEKSIDELNTQLQLAETFYDKQTELWNKGIGSERQYLETKTNYEALQNKLATLKEQYDMSIITAPMNGYVEKIFLKQGELAVPGMQFMQIVDLDKLRVTSKISEAYLPILSKGEKVEITFPTFPDLVLNKTVTRVGNVISQQNRTFLVEIDIDNKDGRLKPNLLANIKINDYNTDAAIVVPSMIIREDMKGSYLYVTIHDGENLISRKKYIQPGRVYQDKTEVTSGLSLGDTIIVDGYSTVSDGMYIEISK